ncbi:unnamed protein product [Lampetra planeri]
MVALEMWHALWPLARCSVVLGSSRRPNFPPNNFPAMTSFPLQKKFPAKMDACSWGALLVPGTPRRRLLVWPVSVACRLKSQDDAALNTAKTLQDAVVFHPDVFRSSGRTGES